MKYKRVKVGGTDALGFSDYHKGFLLKYQRPSTMQPYFVYATGLLSSDGKDYKEILAF